MAGTTTTSPIPDARVLVVDDEAQVRSALVRSLSLLGYRASEACSGAQALEILEHTPYEAMVLDLRMPGMDGIEVMRRARRLWPGLAIIILTGHATLETAISAVKSHAADYLLKPASVHDVASAIDGALGQSAVKLRRQHLLQVMEDALDEVRTMETPSEVSSAPAPQQVLRRGCITLDRDRRLAVVEGDADGASATVALTVCETKLLAYLMQHPDRVLSCRELARHALGYEIGEREAQNIVRPHICRLRRKLEPDPAHPRLIRTSPGKGYLFVP
jgi:two-component system KDP operon response regulator KdpE